MEKIKTRAAIDYRLSPAGILAKGWEIIVDGKIVGYKGSASDAIAEVERLRRERRNQARRERDQVLRDAGMVRVRGNLGGVYWE